MERGCLLPGSDHPGAESLLGHILEHWLFALLTQVHILQIGCFKGDLCRKQRSGSLLIIPTCLTASTRLPEWGSLAALMKFTTCVIFIIFMIMTIMTMIIVTVILIITT